MSENDMVRRSPLRFAITITIICGILSFVVFFGVLAAILQTTQGQPKASADDTEQIYGISRFAMQDIPPKYLVLYQRAGQHYRLDWAVLAGIGKVETDHGRLNATGVTAGENYAGAGGPMQFLAGTWTMYGADGNGDGERDRYAPADAIFGAANYLRASGAPDDYRKAIFAYNHAEWYVNKVLGFAKRYRGTLIRRATTQAPGKLTGGVQRVRGGQRHIVPLPGFPGESCDIRIVSNVVFLAAVFDLTITDCYAATGHEASGEHPRGLAIDAVPKQGGPCGKAWAKVNQLAAWAEPHPNRPRPPFRWVGYNGDPNHGCGNHIHLSWNHGEAPNGGIGKWVDILASSQ